MLVYDNTGFSLATTTETTFSIAPAKNAGNTAKAHDPVRSGDAVYLVAMTTTNKTVAIGIDGSLNVFGVVDPIEPITLRFGPAYLVQGNFLSLTDRDGYSYYVVPPNIEINKSLQKKDGTQPDPVSMPYFSFRNSTGILNT